MFPCYSLFVVAGWFCVLSRWQCAHPPLSSPECNRWTTCLAIPDLDVSNKVKEPDKWFGVRVIRTVYISLPLNLPQSVLPVQLQQCHPRKKRNWNQTQAQGQSDIELEPTQDQFGIEESEFRNWYMFDDFLHFILGL